MSLAKTLMKQKVNQSVLWGKAHKSTTILPKFSWLRNLRPGKGIRQRMLPGVIKFLESGVLTPPLLPT